MLAGESSMGFLAICPECKTRVSVAFGAGTLENLKKGKGDVVLAHATNDPHVGDHTWILTDPEAKARLRSYLESQASLTT